MSRAVRFIENGLDWLVPNWQVPPAVAAFATTRNGGVSVGDRAGLDLGPALLDSLDPPTRGAIVENRARVEAFLPSRPVWLWQVHGARVVGIDAHNLRSFRSVPPQADAAVTRLLDTPIAVRVADCLPVLFADREGSTVAIAHAGWRGLVAGVLEATIDAMQLPAAALIAWIGPGIGAGAFEVGSDVRDAFLSADPASAAHFVGKREDKWLADLSGLAAQRLHRAQVGRIYATGLCTHDDPQRFFSYRRDRSPGRQAAFIWLDAGAAHAHLPDCG